MRLRLVLLALPLVIGSVRAGDPAADADAAVLAAIEKGREAYTGGKPQEAIEHLQKAIGLIQAKAMKGLASFLPARDEKEWELGEIDSQHGNWGTGDQSFQWSQVQRRYSKKGVEDPPEVDVMISNSPQLVESQRAIFEMFKDPAMRAMMNQSNSDEKVDVIDEQGWIAMVTSRKDSCSITGVHKKIMVQIEVQRGDEKLARRFWGDIDKAGLAEMSK